MPNDLATTPPTDPNDNGEKTGPQRNGLWGLVGGAWNGFWGFGATDPVSKMQRASNADALNGNSYDSGPHGIGFPVNPANAPAALADTLIPLTLPLYDAMGNDPTLSIAEQAVILTIMAAETVAVVDDELADDEFAQRLRAIVDLEIIRQREDLLPACLQCLRYGWKDFEVVWTEKTDKILEQYIGIKRFKELNGQNIKFNVTPGGELAQVVCNGVALDPDYFLHITEGSRNDNHFGMSRMERARRAHFNQLSLEDLMQQLVRLFSGKVAVVSVPPETPASKKANKTPNADKGAAIVKSVMNGMGYVYYTTAALDDLEDRLDIADKKLVDVQILDIGNPGPTISAINERIGDLKKDKFRAWTRPERSISESEGGGTRAESESHGSIAIADAETTHERVWRQINRQTVKSLLIANGGEQYIGRINAVAIGLTDSRKQALAEYHSALLEDPAFRAGEIKALGTNGVEGLFAKLDLGTKLEPGKFEYLPQQPAVGQSSDPAPGQAVDPATNPDADAREHKKDDEKDDDDKEDLSAAMVIDDLELLLPVRGE